MSLRRCTNPRTARRAQLTALGGPQKARIISQLSRAGRATAPILSRMENEPRATVPAVAPRVIDLRSEFEAQLRAVARLEHQLTRTVAGRDPDCRDLTEAVSRELAEMLINNKNIRDVLTELAAEVNASVAAG